jgi:hypothetical protein
MVLSDLYCNIGKFSDAYVCKEKGLRLQQKLLVLYDNNLSESPSLETNFYCFCISSSTLRYQVPTTSNVHKFFCGSTQALQIGASSSTFEGTLNANNFSGTGTLTIPAITLNTTSLATTLIDKASLSTTTA